MTINHRLNVFGFTYLGEAAGLGLRAVGRRRHARHRRGAAVGARQHRSLRRRSESRHDLRAVGRRTKSRDADVDAGREGAVPSRHHRERSRAAVDRREKTRSAHTDLLLAELGLQRGQVRELQNVPMARLLAADARGADARSPSREPGMTANSPMVDGKAIPSHPWDPAAPALSAGHSAADRLRADRGDALRPADAGEAGARRSRAEAARGEAPRRRSRSA